VRIKTIISQYRRDFTADYECEHCNHIERKSGYDDYNFHHNVIPKMVCKKCSKIADENYRPLSTKYPEGYQV